MSVKEMWEEILFPMRFDSGGMRFNFVKRGEDSEFKYYRVRYNFETRKWSLSIFEYKKDKTRLKRKRRKGNKGERQIVIQKAIKYLEKEMKDIRRGEIVKEI